MFVRKQAAAVLPHPVVPSADLCWEELQCSASKQAVLLHVLDQHSECVRSFTYTSSLKTEKSVTWVLHSLYFKISFFI